MFGVVQVGGGDGLYSQRHSPVWGKLGKGGGCQEKLHSKFCSSQAPMRFVGIRIVRVRVLTGERKEEVGRSEFSSLKSH